MSTRKPVHKDAQETWDAYYSRLRERRQSEADLLWAEMEASGVTAETVLALDFSHFSSERAAAESLADQLAENYTVQVTHNAANGYWFVNGTTRPSGITLEQEQHRGWVEFMSDVAKSHACVFGSWTLESPRLGKRFSSEEFDVE
jgi:hypothetical protein